ncbi:MAG: hypothetical protein DPW09_06965 [Anaerolineae bacterium]|nr:hypothetical protein [Anaerolineae bacterium]
MLVLRYGREVLAVEIIIFFRHFQVIFVLLGMGPKQVFKTILIYGGRLLVIRLVMRIHFFRIRNLRTAFYSLT